jgi:hypothetical protein
MSKQNSLPNADHAVRLPQGEIGGTVRAIRSVDPGTAPLPPHGARELSHNTSYAVAPVEKPDRSPIGWWLATLAFFIEGCAMYGASLYPGAEFPVKSAPASAKARKPRPVLVQQPAAAEHGSPDPLEDSVITGLSCTVWADLRPQRRWSWLNSIGRGGRDDLEVLAPRARYPERGGGTRGIR